MKTMPFIQPNDSSGYVALNFSPRFWLLVVITGIGAGLGASLLMALLAVVQHWSYSYSSGDFQHAVELVSPWRHVWIMAAAGLLATVVIWLLKHYWPGKDSDAPKAIWFRSGHLPFIRNYHRRRAIYDHRRHGSVPGAGRGTQASGRCRCQRTFPLD